MNLRRLIFSTGIILVMLLFVSPRAGGAEVLRLLVYEGYAPAHQVELFKKHIKAKYQRDVEVRVSFIANPTEIFHALRQRKADVVSPTHNIIKDTRFSLITKRLILSLRPENIPRLKDLSGFLLSGEYMYHSGAIYAVPMLHGYYGLAYRADQVEEPQSWNALWNEKYKDKYTLAADYYEVNIYITALALGLKQEEIYRADLVRGYNFRKKLDALARNAGNLWRGVDKPSDLQNMSLAVVWGFSLPGLREMGQNWRIANPREGTMYWVDNLAIAHHLKDKPFLRTVAEEWVNWCLGPDFQMDVVVKGLGSMPVNHKVMAELEKDGLAARYFSGAERIEARRIPWPTIRNSRDRSVMQTLWERALAKRR